MGLLVLLQEALRYFRSETPPGALILTDEYTALVLEHYLGGDKWPIMWIGRETRFGGYRVFRANQEFASLDDIHRDLRMWHKQEPLWTYPNLSG